MRTLQLVTTAERSFFQQQVESLRARGIDCTVLEVPGTHDADAPRTPSDYARYLRSVLGRSLDDFDVVHANYGLVAPFALAQPTRPVVVTFWGTDLMGSPWLRRLGNACARFVDRVVLPSSAMGEYLQRDYDRIPFGVDVETFRPIPKARARREVGWSQDRPIVLFPYDTERPEKDYPRARRVVDRLDADVDLRAISGVDHADVPLYMNASDAVLVTSRRESGPMVVKEAVACNVPVVSTDVGFVRETLEPVSCSAVCRTDAELADALAQVLRMNDRPNGREVLSGLDPDSLGEQLEAVYTDLLGGVDE
ncbi:glycosyltransferase family 4 protein [Haloarculaceae archaeon H-GB2-1]|nr:glycosyltransferase family 4 protein [Haloarculaceae archaeon H-GB1-1]MEA5408408.1 glycosyltransferase family 4 protein [Haloarculaceae archaeon H-GB2-1]